MSVKISSIGGLTAAEVYDLWLQDSAADKRVYEKLESALTIERARSEKLREALQFVADHFRRDSATGYRIREVLAATGVKP